MGNKVLDDTLYCYVEKENADHARTQGAELFGSFSAYVNALIAKDRGAKPRLGKWKAKGESKQIRKNLEKIGKVCKEEVDPRQLKFEDT